MSLSQYQTLLARLWTDAALRDQFARDSREVGAAHGLNQEEIETLLTLPLPEIQSFANALRNKRRQEVANFLPLTQRALGERYGTLFARYAVEHAPRGPNGLRADAIGFAAHLAAELEPQLRDLARYEAAWLRMAEDRRHWLVQRYGYPMRQLIRSVERGEEIDKVKPSRRLGLWWRLGCNRPIRHRLMRV